MDQLEERLAEEVRRYEHLYNPSSKHYKDAQMGMNSWREIATIVGLEVPECIKKWRAVRDKYVRLRKKMAKSGGGAGGQKVPALCSFLSWLTPHIKHRKTSSNYDDEEATAPCTPDTEGPAQEDEESSSTHTPPSSVASMDSPQPSTSNAPRPATLLESPQPCASSSAARTSSITAARPPASGPAPSPRSRLGQRRKRQRDEDEHYAKQMEELATMRRALMTQVQQADACSRFGAVMVDMLRAVPAQRRQQVMAQLYGLLFQELSNE